MRWLNALRGVGNIIKVKSDLSRLPPTNKIAIKLNNDDQISNALKKSFGKKERGTE